MKKLGVLKIHLVLALKRQREVDLVSIRPALYLVQASQRYIVRVFMPKKGGGAQCEPRFGPWSACALPVLPVSTDGRLTDSHTKAYYKGVW